MQTLGQLAAAAFLKSAGPGQALGNIAKQVVRRATPTMSGVKLPTPQLPKQLSKPPIAQVPSPARSPSGWRDWMPTRRDVVTGGVGGGGAGLATVGGGIAAYNYASRVSPHSPDLPNWMAPVVSPAMPPETHYAKQPDALPDLMRALPQDSRDEAMRLWHGETTPEERAGLSIGPDRPLNLITTPPRILPAGLRPKLDQAAVQLLHRRNAYGAPLRFGGTRNGAEASADSLSPGVTVTKKEFQAEPTYAAAGTMNHELEHIRQRAGR
jgi:hypothetical protein